MTKTSATQLKAKLGRFMQAVRAGEEIVITDRDVPVARLIPFGPKADEGGSLVISRARHATARRPGDVDVRGIRYQGPSTTLLLQADRDRR